MKKVPKNIAKHITSIPSIPDGLYVAETFGNTIVILGEEQRYVIHNGFGTKYYSNLLDVLVIDNKVYKCNDRYETIEWLKSTGKPFITVL